MEMNATIDDRADSPIITIDDFQSKLDCHIIRRTTKKNKLPREFHDIYCLPILIDDISKIEFPAPSKQNPFSIYGKKFYKLQIFGYLAVNKISEKFKIYSIDDGTGTIIIRHDQSEQQVNMCRKIDSIDLNIVKARKGGLAMLGLEYSDPNGTDCKNMLDSMRALIRIAKERAYKSHKVVPTGSRVCVTGKPFKTQYNGIQIRADEITVGDSNGNDEDHFRKRLAEVYETLLLRKTD